MKAAETVSFNDSLGLIGLSTRMQSIVGTQQFVQVFGLFAELLPNVSLSNSPNPILLHSPREIHSSAVVQPHDILYAIEYL